MTVTRDESTRPGTLRVTVRDGRTDAAVPEASVKLEGARRPMATDERGDAQLTFIAAGSRVLEVRRVGYQTRQDTIQLEDRFGQAVIARLQHARLCFDTVLQVRGARRHRDLVC
jgi:carboxypeptidase family protein